MSNVNDASPLFVTAIEGRAQGEVGEELGMSQQKVSLIVRGKARPDEVERILIEVRYGIPRDSWLTDEERRRINKMRETVLRASSKKPSQLVAA